MLFHFKILTYGVIEKRKGVPEKKHEQYEY